MIHLLPFLFLLTCALLCVVGISILWWSANSEGRRGIKKYMSTHSCWYARTYSGSHQEQKTQLEALETLHSWWMRQNAGAIRYLYIFWSVVFTFFYNMISYNYLFISDMRKDVQEIFRSTPHGKQVMMFSATLSKEIRPVCKKFMQDVRCDDYTFTFNSAFAYKNRFTNIRGVG